MPLPPVALLAASLSWTAPVPSPAGQDQADPMVAEGAHFAVVCWFFSERLRAELPRELSLALEDAWTEAQALYGLSPEPLTAHFQVHVYSRGSAPTFKDAVEAVEPGAASGRASWRHWPSRAAHVKLRPVVPDRVLEWTGVPADTLRRAVTEGAQLARLEASGGDDGAPEWFATGSAAWIAQRALVARGRSAAGTEGVWWSTAVATTLRQRAEGRLASLEALLAGERREPQAEDDGEGAVPAADAVHATLFAFLVEGGVDGGDLWQRLARGLGADEARAELERLAGEGGLAALEARFHAWLDAQEPRWEEQEPSLAAHPGGWIQSPVRPRGNAICWVHEPPAWPEYEIRGELRPFRDPGTGASQSNLLVGRLPSGDYLHVAIHTISGVSAWTYAAETGVYELVESKALEASFPFREWVPFRLRVADDNLHITVGDLELKPVPVRGRDMSGQWGLGTFEGCTTLWRAVEIGPSGG